VSERPTWTPAEEVECLKLANDAKGWLGCNLAEIRIGRWGDLWMVGTSTHLTSPHSSYSEPMGVWRDHEPRTYLTRADALAEGIRRIRERQAGCLPKRALDWLDELEAPQQADLFGAAA